MHPEFKKGFNWTLGSLYAVVMFVIIAVSAAAIAASALMGLNQFYWMIDGWIYK